MTNYIKEAQLIDEIDSDIYRRCILTEDANNLVAEMLFPAVVDILNEPNQALRLTQLKRLRERCNAYMDTMKHVYPRNKQFKQPF